MRRRREKVERRTMRPARVVRVFVRRGLWRRGRIVVERRIFMLGLN